MSTKEVNLEEIVGKKFRLHDNFRREKTYVDGTIFTPNKIDYEFIFRMDLFNLGSVILPRTDLKIDQEEQSLILAKPAGAMVYSHDHTLFHTLKDFELRNNYLTSLNL